MTILEYLRKNGISVAADCGGNGTCGKCRVCVNDGLHKYESLACRTEYRQGMGISVLNADVKMAAFPEKTGKRTERNENEEYGIAVDIGTTTIAAVIIDINTGNIIASGTAMNSCRAYGSDVISRIKASSEGHREDMSLLMKKDLFDIISALVIKTGINKITKVAIAANTAMVHILMGYDAACLGMYPYTPVNISLIEGEYGDVIDGSLAFMNRAKVYIMPGISTFVGGDIVSGLFCLDLRNSGGVTAFMDLGTNGEMAVAASGRIIAASASAGPVFEGANISCGTGSIPGAISHVSIIRKHDVKVSVIEDRPPVGICGTGVIETVSELLRVGAADWSGLLKPEWCDGGTAAFTLARRTDGSRISFSQKDIRALQLGKAAIRAGFNIIMAQAGIEASDIAKMYIAGGFGFSLNTGAAVDIGLLPEEVRYRTVSAGNTSLKGAVKLITGDTDRNIAELAAIKASAVTSELNENPDFNDIYIKELNFSKF